MEELRQAEAWEAAEREELEAAAAAAGTSLRHWTAVINTYSPQRCSSGPHLLSHSDAAELCGSAAAGAAPLPTFAVAARSPSLPGHHDASPAAAGRVQRGWPGARVAAGGPTGAGAGAGAAASTDPGSLSELAAVAGEKGEDEEEEEFWRLMAQEVEPQALAAPPATGADVSCNMERSTIAMGCGRPTAAPSGVSLTGASGGAPGGARGAVASGPARHAPVPAGAAGTPDGLLCPLCRMCNLRELNSVVFCKCGFKLDTHAGLTLSSLQSQLAAAYAQHAAACAADPVFSLEERFGLKALYLGCTACGDLQVVL